MSLRKIIKTRGSFPSEDAAIKLLYLALRNVSGKWETMQHWKEALNHFEMLWGERIAAALADKRPAPFKIGRPATCNRVMENCDRNGLRQQGV